jgi:uncharacterized membrane protein
MEKSYNEVAGRSVERLAAISDGIFGVAMTLLLLDLHVPDRNDIVTSLQLAHALVHLLPQLAVYLISFITLGIFWVGQQTQLNYLEQSDRHLTWLYLAFLFMVTLMPFSTRLLTDFITLRTALLAYWLNILLLGMFLYFCWARATRASFLKSDVSDGIKAAVYRRILVAQSLYAFGAALCFINNYVSIAVIALVQLNYVVAPQYSGIVKEKAAADQAQD